MTEEKKERNDIDFMTSQSAKSKLCQNHNKLWLGGDLRVTRSGAVSLTAEWFARSLYQMLVSLAPKFPPLEKSKCGATA